MLIDQTSGLPQDPTLVTWTWPDEADAIERHVRLLANTKLVFSARATLPTPTATT
jgi:hypothetical protein